MRLAGLDALFSVLVDPTAFFTLEMIWGAKVATGLGFMAWTATFTVIPVPGSLTVQSIQTHTTTDIIVPTVNLAKDPTGGPIYTFSPIRSYNTAGPIPQSVANKTLIDQDIATWTSPCGAGADYSYNLTFFAPSFKCSASTSTAVQAVVPIWNVQALIKGTDTDTLSVQYLSDLEGNIISKTNCTSFNSTYSLAVAYHDNQQKINILNITLGSTFGTNATIIIDDGPHTPNPTDPDGWAESDSPAAFAMHPTSSIQEKRHSRAAKPTPSLHNKHDVWRCTRPGHVPFYPPSAVAPAQPLPPPQLPKSVRRTRTCAADEYGSDCEYAGG
ncbi:hypothetical protein B0H14DRAFT_3901993 [Mycena olivaceomarginata]|nr:hypothetical protein B0H14DRAFT_3901993 [Mycena olivaceomarginata]